MGISDRRLRQYFEQGCPKGSLDEIRQWRDSNISQDVPANELKEALDRAELRRRNADARKKEIENEQLEGKLILRSKVEKDIAAFCVRARSRLVGLGAEIAAIVPGEVKATAKSKVETAVRLALKEIADAEVAGE